MNKAKTEERSNTEKAHRKDTLLKICTAGRRCLFESNQYNVRDMSKKKSRKSCIENKLRKIEIEVMEWLFEFKTTMNNMKNHINN